MFATEERASGGPWEYRVASFGGLLRAVRDEDLEAELNAWGDDGWRVVATHRHDNSNRLTVIACRPLTATRRRERSRQSE